MYLSSCLSFTGHFRFECCNLIVVSIFEDVWRAFILIEVLRCTMQDQQSLLHMI